MTVPRLSAFALGATMVCASALGGAARAEARTIPPLVTPADGGAAWSPADRAALREKLDALFRDAAAIHGAHVGLYAADARDGSALYARTRDDEFMPASTLKLLVGSVALARLGTGFRFHTEAFVTAPPERDGALNATLVLRGGGDPFLRAADVSSLGDAVVAAGVRQINDDVRVDASYFDAQPYPPGWVWDDFAYYYAPVVSAASFEENVLHITVTAGTTVGAPAQVTPSLGGFLNRDPLSACEPTLSAVVFKPYVTTVAPGTEPSVDLGRERGGCIAVSGTIPLHGDPDIEDAAVPSAAVYLRDAMLAVLRERGVAVSPGVRLDAQYGEEHAYHGPVAGNEHRTIWSHDSEPMPRLLADMWYPSDNLLAELLLKSLGVARSGVPGTTENGAALEREYLQSIGVDPKTVTLRDGSGLSIYDRITPRDLVAILQSDWKGPNRGIVLDALPVAGVRGTLREEFVGSGADGRAFVKTGSMSHVRGLAGFLATKRHGTVTFALMVDDWNGVASELDAFRGAVLARLVNG